MFGEGSFYGHRDWLQKRPVSDRGAVIAYIKLDVAAPVGRC